MRKKIILYIILANCSVFADFSSKLLDEIGQCKEVDAFNSFGQDSSGLFSFLYYYRWFIPKFVELCGSVDKALMSFAPHAVVDKNGDFYSIDLYCFSDKGPNFQITKITSSGSKSTSIFYPWYRYIDGYRYIWGKILFIR